MFLIRFILNLVSAPLWLVATAAGLVSPPLAARTHALIWQISGNERAGAFALARYLHSGGIEIARTEADKMLRRRPTPVIAAMMGMVEFGAGDLDAAERYLVIAQEAGADVDGQTETLEYMLAVSKAGGRRGMTEINERMEQRRDLSPMLRKMVLESQMLTALLDGAYDSARRRAEHLLEVADHPTAEIILWAIHLRAGETARAEAHLARSEAMAPVERLHSQYMAARAIGRNDEAANILESLQAYGDEEVEHARQVANTWAMIGRGTS